MAKRRGLTAVAVENLKPAAVRREVSDERDGLFLVLQPSGAKSWAVRYRFNGKPQKLTLGKWPALTLAAAREAAARARREIEQGRDPGMLKKAVRRANALARADTVLAVGEQYLNFIAKRLRTAGHLRATFERLIFPALRSRPIGEVRRSDIVRLLDKIEEERGPRAADEALACYRQLANWFAARHDTYNSPIVRGMARTTPESRRRDRVLSDGELVRVWRAAGAAGAFGAFVRFLIVSGARRNEAAAMRFRELDGNKWTLPAARNKAGVDLLRPLPPLAMSILDALPHDGEFVFGGKEPLTSFAHPKEKLDAASGVTAWRLHDTRRVARSLLSRARVPNEHAEAVLGHVLRGVRKTYDVHDYAAEKAHALAMLAAQIERIVEPRDNVTALRG